MLIFTVLSKISLFANPSSHFLSESIPTRIALPFFVIAWAFILVPPSVNFLNSALAEHELLRTILIPMTWTLIPSFLSVFFAVMAFAQLVRQAQVGCIPKKFGDVILKMVGELKEPTGRA